MTKTKFTQEEWELIRVAIENCLDVRGIFNTDEEEKLNKILDTIAKILKD